MAEGLEYVEDLAGFGKVGDAGVLCVVAECEGAEDDFEGGPWFECHRCWKCVCGEMIGTNSWGYQAKARSKEFAGGSIGALEMNMEVRDLPTFCLCYLRIVSRHSPTLTPHVSFAKNLEKVLTRSLMV